MPALAQVALTVTLELYECPVAESVWVCTSLHPVQVRLWLPAEVQVAALVTIQLLQLCVCGVGVGVSFFLLVAGVLDVSCFCEDAGNVWLLTGESVTGSCLVVPGVELG